MEYMVSLFKLFTQHWELKQHTALVEKKHSAGQPTRTLHLYALYLYTYIIYSDVTFAGWTLPAPSARQRAGI